MNTIADRFHAVSGSVTPYIITPEGKKVFRTRHNLVLDSANLLLAKLLAGGDFAPTHIVFVVGTVSGQVGFEDDYDALKGNNTVSAAELLAPTINTADKSVTFTTHTGLGDTVIPDTDGYIIGRAILVCKKDGTNTPFSAIDLGEFTVPEGAYFGLYWKISFGITEPTSSGTSTSA